MSSKGIILLFAIYDQLLMLRSDYNVGVQYMVFTWVNTEMQLVVHFKSIISEVKMQFEDCIVDKLISFFWVVVVNFSLYSLWCPYSISYCYTPVELQMFPCSKYILQSNQIYICFILYLFNKKKKKKIPKKHGNISNT